MFTALLPFATANRTTIIRIFQIFYGFVLLWLGFVVSVNVTNSKLFPFTYEVGTTAGTVAVCAFFIVTIPGILGRFKIKHPLITIGIMFRRHTGLSTFFIALLHASSVHIIPSLVNGEFPVTLSPSYILFGSVALTALSLLALTSNNFSVQKIGKNWKRLHKVVYVIFWLLFLHVGLQSEYKTAAAIGIVGVLEIASLLYDWQQKKTVLPPTPQSPQIPLTA